MNNTEVKEEQVNFIWESICATCLSQDRKLYPPPDHFATCFQDLSLSEDDKLCWECHHTVLKMTAFRSRVQQAQAMFADLLSGKNRNVRSLSCLSLSKMAVDTFHIEEATDLKAEFCLELVKEEPLDTPSFDVDVKCEVDSDDEMGDETSEVNDEMGYEEMGDDDEDETLMEILKRKKPRNTTSIIMPTLYVLKGADTSETEDTSTNSNFSYSDTNKSIPVSNAPKEKEKEKVEVVNPNFTYSDVMTKDDILEWRKRKESLDVYTSSVYKCEKCIEPFENLNSYRNHEKRHTNLYGEVACEICEMRTSDAAAMAHHMKSQHRLLKCNYCAHEWDNANAMRRHCSEAHAVPIAAWSCDQCGHEFGSWQKLSVHSRTHRVRSCPECGLLLRSSLERHMLRAHPDLPSRACWVCSAECKGDSGLKAHMEKHKKNSEAAYCAECDVHFSNKYVYRAHLRKTLRHAAPEDLKSHEETKKRRNALPTETRDIYVAKREKQMERFLLPGAPPRKQTRKQSPERTECRVVPGSPATPPARKLMPWEIIDDPDCDGLATTPRRQIEPECVTPTRDDPDCHGLATPRRQIEPECVTPTSVISLDGAVEGPGCSPLRVGWTTRNMWNQTPATHRPREQAPSKANSNARNKAPVILAPCTLRTQKAGPSNIIKQDTKTKHNKNEVVAGLDHGTTTAEIFEGWWKAMQDDSDKDEEDDVDDDKPTPVDIACEEPAILPPNIAEDVRQWLEDEDVDADKTITSMIDLTFDWTSNNTTFKGQRETFAATPGPTFDLDDTTTPLDVFRKFFDDSLLDFIVTQTNKHSNLLIDQITTEHSRLNKWQNTDREEILIFLSILILQGLAPLHFEADYFKENGYLTLKYFKNLMTYNRFNLLKRMLYFTDDMTDLTGLTCAQKKLRKIQPVLDHLNQKFGKLYIPKQNVAIDESLLKWHGRLSFAQKIATKAAKVGVRSYELCESDTGYLWSFFVYTGKTDGVGRPDDNDLTDGPATSSASSMPPTNATAQIVHLAKPLLGLGYTLIMNNFYNSPLLARYLKSQKTDCFGTLRVSREFVPEAIKSQSKEIRVGELVQSFSRDLSIVLWRGTNIVAMISTFHEGEGGKEKYGRCKYKPRAVLDYNASMGGVDRKDQLLSAHPIERSKNMAWYKKVFRRLLNVSIHNAFVIFKSRNTNITNRAFRRRLADEMIAAYLPVRVSNPLVKAKAVVQSPGGQKRAILQGNHFIGQGPSKSARCRWCNKSRSKYMCKQCEVTLCLEICFEEYHTKY